MHYTSIEEVSKKIFYEKQFKAVTTHKKCSKLLQWKIIEPTYNVNTHCNLLYVLNVWNYLNSIPKKANFSSSVTLFELYSKKANFYSLITFY